MSRDQQNPMFLSANGLHKQEGGEWSNLNSKTCAHQIVGEDYGICRLCDANFFMISGGLWQSYETGKRYIPTAVD